MLLFLVVTPLLTSPFEVRHFLFFKVRKQILNEKKVQRVGKRKRKK